MIKDLQQIDVRGTVFRDIYFKCAAHVQLMAYLSMGSRILWLE